MKVFAMFTAVGLFLQSGAAIAAGPSASDSASASADIIKQISVSCPDTMEFGTLVSPNADSSVTVSPDGAGLSDPNEIVLPGTRTFASPAGCVATGEPGFSYHVTLPSSATTLNDGSGHSMSLDTFIIRSEVDGDPYNRLLSTPAGQNTFSVGATLHVATHQFPGHYQGTFPVMVQYN